MTHYHIQSDSRKRLRFEVGVFKSFYNDSVSDEKSIFTSLSVRASNKLDFSLSPEYTVKKDNWQYVTTRSVNDMSGETLRYIIGCINQKTLDFTIRLNYYITPDLSLQYYGQPFISAGHYSDFKRITDPKAKKMDDRYQPLIGNNIHIDPQTGNIEVDENRDGIQDYQIENPNFNVRAFRSNLVLRWEYQPGSTFFLVWTHGRSQRVANGSFDFSHDLKQMFDIYPYNVLLVKFNHWCSI